MGSFKVKKVLNNNVLIAGHDTFQEVVLIGKGIGFGKKRGELISNETVEKIFVLKNEQEQEQYKKTSSLYKREDDRSCFRLYCPHFKESRTSSE